jgi:tRNA modification GTPase
VEAEGVRRAHQEIAKADRVLFVVDAADAAAVASIEQDLAALPSEAPRTVVLNKIDRVGGEPHIEAGETAHVHLSAATGAGLDLLRQHLKDCVGFHPAGTGVLSARARHLDALRRARAHVEEAHRLLTERHAGELVAQELTDAQKQLGEITGQVTSDELLGRIFGSFCIGK